MSSPKSTEKSSKYLATEVNSSSNASSDILDDHYKIYESVRDIEIDPAEAKRVRRKIDWRILSLLMITYILQYMDKISINLSSVYGLQKSLHLHGQEYSWLGSMFYVGYLVFQFPFGYLLQRLPTGRLLSVTIICWGIVLICSPACKNFGGMAVNRFFLGAFESAINPGFVLIMSIWYKNNEQPVRLVGYYSTIGIATMFSGLIGYGVGHIKTGLQKWMYVFIIFGAISIAWGLISLLFLPDGPSNARFLTAHERAIAVERVATNKAGIKTHKFKPYQAIQALRDPKTWILFVMTIASQLPTAAITSFASINISSFGFDTLQSQYMLIPGGAVQFLVPLFGGWVGTRWPGTRCAVMVVANLVCIVGAGLLVGLSNSNKWGRLVALWLCYSQNLGQSMSLTILSSNIAGFTKKQVTGAVVFTGYCIGNIVGPQTFITKEAPKYRTAYISMLVAYSIKLLMVFILYVHMRMFNRARDQEAAAATARAGPDVVINEKEAIELGMHDVTELDNKGFRYIL